MRIVWHPKPDIIAIVISMNNVPIRLTVERWLHIIEFHKELEGFRSEILLTIANPDILYSSPLGVTPNFAAVKVFDRLASFGLARNLVVHYREVSSFDGFILTAFVMSNDGLKRRFRLWRKLR
ncbi:MAG: hypothetical protein QXZ53_07635 [Candidatus Bathyarchaeia archaeon]